MKTRQQVLMTALVLWMASLASLGCKKDNPGEDPIQSQPQTSITFKVLQDSTPLADVLIGITPNSNDRDNGDFLYTGNTSATGKYKFGPITPNMYYYAASWHYNGTTLKRTGAVVVAEYESKLDTIDF